MRRNNMPRGSHGGGTSGGPHGPLLTDHLRDLDLELELLKRKREMVEQQQQLLSSNVSSQPYQHQSQRQFNQGGYNDNFVQPNQNFNQPRGSHPPSLLSNHNFSYLYDKTPQPFRQQSNFDRQFGNKRPSTDPIWQNNAPPKRFSGPQRPPQRPPVRRNDVSRRPAPPPKSFPRNNNQRSGPAPAPARSMPTGQRFGNSGPVAPNKRFSNSSDTRPRQRNVTNNKIHKPTSSAPNKLNTYPTEQRKALVKEALQHAKSRDQVLLADEPPNKQTTGRMELALGNILKELKQQYAEVEEFKDHFVKISLHRAVKNVIRDRLRSTMLGKPVGIYPEIIKAYRVKFPVETDKEILVLASEKVKEETDTKLSIKLVDEVHPERYFRYNFQRLLKSTLEEMLAKLEEIYVKNEEWKKDAIKIENSFPKSENANIDGEIDKSTENVTEDTSANDGNNTTEMSATKDETKGNNITLDNTGDIAEEKKDDLDEKSEDGKAEKNDETSIDESKKIQYYDNIVTMLLKRKLPTILPKYKDFILRLLNVNQEYRQTRAAIIMKTNQKADKLVDERKQVDTVKQKANKSITESPNKANKSMQNAAKTPKNPAQDTPFIVKVFARPSLPKRPVMQGFLDKFKPKTVKRHKNVHNLLFIGFTNEEDYNSILKEDNCKIGKSSISIKPGDKNKEDADKTTVAVKDETTTAVEAKIEPAPDTPADISISSDLDDQITDLLFSINQNDDQNVEQKDDENQNIEGVAEEAANTEDKSDEPANGNAEEAPNAEEKLNPDAEINEVKDDVAELKNDALDAVKETVKATPTRASTRLAASTPNTVKARQASKPTQN